MSAGGLLRPGEESIPLQGKELLGVSASHGPFYETPGLCQVVIEEFRLFVSSVPTKEGEYGTRPARATTGGFQQ